MRTVTVRYLVPVYATVDLDAKPDSDGWYGDDAVVRVFEGDETIVRLDDEVGIATLTSGDVLTDSYEDNPVDPGTLSPRMRAKALRIAEHAMWPTWERG